MSKYDTAVKDWFIVQLENNEKKIVAEILWGIIENDNKNYSVFERKTRF